MSDDPTETAPGSRDLYGISTWEPRTAADRLSLAVYRLGLLFARTVVILLALGILLVQIALGGLGVTFTQDPYALGLVVLSVVPALALAVYIYVADVTSGEPLELLVGAFVLGVLFAGFAGELNGLFSALLSGTLGFVVAAVGFEDLFSFLATLILFYVVVGPIEEAVKLLAVRLYPYRDGRFDSVIDGAVYGAAAGLGFATIENALYISQQLNASGETAMVSLLSLGGALTAQSGGSIQQLLAEGGGITAVRALAGPGHVIYSAFAGYYLGLAKFNREHAGPIVVKGLLIAATIHATYNVAVGQVPQILHELFPQVPIIALFFGFVVVYDGLFGFLLVRKLGRYRRVYQSVTADEASLAPERTEFDP